jgi:hypothetical protein
MAVLVGAEGGECLGALVTNLRCLAGSPAWQPGWLPALVQTGGGWPTGWRGGLRAGLLACGGVEELVADVLVVVVERLLDLDPPPGERQDGEHRQHHHARKRQRLDPQRPVVAVHGHQRPRQREAVRGVAPLDEEVQAGRDEEGGEDHGEGLQGGVADAVRDGDDQHAQRGGDGEPGRVDRGGEHEEEEQDARDALLARLEEGVQAEEGGGELVEGADEEQGAQPEGGLALVDEGQLPGALEEPAELPAVAWMRSTGGLEWCGLVSRGVACSGHLSSRRSPASRSRHGKRMGAAGTPRHNLARRI